MRLAVVVCALALAQEIGWCDAWTVPAGTWRFSPSISFYSAQRQYASNGETTHLFYEGTFDFAVITIYGEMGLTQDLTLIGDLPVGHAVFEARDSLHAYTRTLTQPSYYGLGARYALWRPGSSIVSVSAAVHVPPGFHQGLFDDPSHPFLSDGFFEGIARIEFGTRVKWGWIEAIAAYHARAEEAANQLELRGVVGFASQEHVKIKLTFQAVKSLAPLPDLPLDVEETTIVENYVWMDGQMLFDLSDRLTLGASIGVRVLGEHTLSLSGGTLTVLF